MLTGIYRSASAMDFLSRQQEAIAHNLANINTSGFRRTVMVVERAPATPLKGPSTNETGEPTEALHAQERVDFSPGSIRRTDRSLDFALDGDAFFSVQVRSPKDGSTQTMYTRNGNFHLNPTQQLVTGSGDLVLSNGAPITLPSTEKSDAIKVDNQGNIRIGAVPLGQFDLVKFAANSALRPIGNSLFMAPDNVVGQPAEAQVQQYSLESANTSAVAEMVQMISGLRSFEAAQKSLRALDEALQQYINNDQ